MIHGELGEINKGIFKLDEAKQAASKMSILDINHIVNKIKYSNNINQIALWVVVLLSIVGKIINQIDFRVRMLGEAILSILIFAVFLKVLYKIARGELSFKKSINLSVYIHMGVIVANICNNIPVVSVITFIGAQLLGVYFQYLVGVQVAYAELKILKNICLVQLLLILLSLVIQILTSWGMYVAYSTKVYHFPLV